MSACDSLVDDVKVDGCATGTLSMAAIIRDVSVEARNFLALSCGCLKPMLKTN